MKGRTAHPIKSVSGHLDKDHYASVDPTDSSLVIIKHKPRHKDGWQKPPSMVQQTAAFKGWITEATRAYRDPVERAALQSEYDAWLRNRQRHGITSARPGEPRIRSLWDFTRWKYANRPT